MKRLIKKSDAVRLNSLGLNPDQVFTSIQNSDWEFHPDKLITDIHGEKAIWGAISDDGQYIVELYAYNVEFGKKCAIVICKIENEIPSTKNEVIIEETDSLINIKNSIISNGVTTLNGLITFKNGYKSLNEINHDTENIAMIKRK